MLSYSQPYFEEAKKTLRTADHIIYITYPVLKENRLLIKVLEEIYSAVQKTVELIMNHEYEMKRIKIYSDPKLNMTLFEQKCASRYNFTSEEMMGIKQIIELFHCHKSSPVEFARQNKFIIMSDDLRTESITVQRLKGLLNLAKGFIRKAENSISTS